MSVLPLPHLPPFLGRTFAGRKGPFGRPADLATGPRQITT